MKEKAMQDEKAKLKSEIFELKHGGKVRILKNIGKSIAKGAVKAGKGFANYAEKYNERSSSQSIQPKRSSKKKVIITRKVKKRRASSQGNLYNSSIF